MAGHYQFIVRRASAVLALVWNMGAAQSVRSAQMLEGAGQLAAAFDEYRQVVVANPGDRLALSGLVRLAQEVGRSDSLLALSRRLLAAHQDRPDFALGVVEGLFGLGRVSEARAELRRVARASPSLLPELADIAVRHKERAEAVTLYRQARERAGTDLLFAERLIPLYEELGQHQAAVREVVAILQRRPDEVNAYTQKLSAYAGKVDTRALIAELDKLSPVKTRARAQAAVMVALGRNADAVQLLRTALADQELFRQAQDWETEGRLEAALAAYRALAAHTRAAQVLRRLGRMAEAREALSRDPGPGAQFELAELMLDDGDFQAAAAAYNQVLKQNPGHAPALFGMARAQLGLGEARQARTFVRRLDRLQDRELLLVARSFFVEAAFDSAAYYASQLVRTMPQSELANDGLELLLLTRVARSDSTALAELARAMFELETRAFAAGTRRAQTLAQGSGPVAEAAELLTARFLVSERQSARAVAVLDSFEHRFPSSPLRPRARLEAARIVRDELADPAGFRQRLEALVLDYPGSPYSAIARSLLAGAPATLPSGSIR